MYLKPYRTAIVVPSDVLTEVIIEHVPHIPEKSVLVITSKIVSITQNRIIPIEQVPDKMQLIHQEADAYLEGDYSKQYGICLTMKNGILIPTAGIDASNADNAYILYPLNLQAEIIHTWEVLKKHYQIQDLGILVTDSHTTPLRRGVTGIALGWCGFKPLRNYIGEPDIYGHPLRVTQTNIVDSLASAAVFMMGEGGEQTPLALITDVDSLSFQKTPPTDDELKAIVIPMAEDLYAPLLTSVSWTKLKSH